MFPFSKSIWTYSLALLGVLFVIVIYVWFVSIGQWINWPRTTGYYDQLAGAFQSGRLDLPIKPDPQLLALSDPYDPNQRGSIARVDYIWDMSLYKGKIFLYFGPAPALILLPVKWLVPGKISDDALAFVFLAAILIVQALLLVKIRSQFFPSIPPWMVMAAVLTTGLIAPILYVLSFAGVHEVAILSGQFFLLTGLYFAYRAVERLPSGVWNLGVAGFAWVCAVGSRALLLIPVLFMCCMVTLWIAQNYFQSRALGEAVRQLFVFGLPLALGAFLLGWYNGARFDSPFETGLRYQITDVDLTRSYTRMFQPAYVLPNTYSYITRSFDLSPVFPFLVMIPFPQAQSLALQQIRPPYISYDGIGVLTGMPFLLFALFAVGQYGRSRFKQSGAEPLAQVVRSYSWLLLSLVGIDLFVLGGLLLFFNSAMKYLIDALYSLSLLAVLGSWQAYRYLEKKAVVRKIYLLFTILLSAYSVLISALLALSINAYRFIDKNPTLFNFLVLWFGKFIK